MRLPHVKTTSTLWLSLRISIFFLIALSISADGEPAPYKLPRFRAVQSEIKMPAFPQGTLIRIAADADFPPYSFQTRAGVPAGLSVELALAACAEIKVKCEVALKALPALLPGLASREHDVIVSGPRIDEKALEHALMTRPWFRTFGRFAAQSGKPLAGGDARNLAGSRIGAVKGTAHAAWLGSYYTDSELLTFDSEAEAQEALRTGAIDALFGDNLRLIYWITGGNSRGCCKLFGGAYSDFETFSRNIAFLVSRDRADIRDAFDVALDRMQTNGTTEKLFNTYVPLNPW
jgi:polar amino acid transport system substrate-binding protein